MDVNDVLFCGLIWAQFRRPEAGFHLLDAAESSDPELKCLAQAMLEQAGVCSSELVNGAIEGENNRRVECKLVAYTPGNTSSSLSSDFWWMPTTNA